MATENLYCDQFDVTERLPLGAVTSSSALAAETSIGLNTITLDGHGFKTDDAISFRAIEGGALPAPLVAGVQYYARRVSNSLFEVAAAPGGPAIDLTSVAVSMAVAREPVFDKMIEFYSRWADTSLPGHLVPLTQPIHPFVKGIVADLVAKRLQNIGGQESAVITAAEVEAKAQLQRFATGLPLRGAPVTSSANRAVTSSLGGTGSFGGTNDPRGWGSTRLP